MLRTHALALVLALSLVHTACAGGGATTTTKKDPVAAKPAAKPDATPEPAKPDNGSRQAWAKTMRSNADFMAFSKEIAGERYSKFAIDVGTGQIYFFDVKVYPLHQQFVFAQIYKQKWTRQGQARFAKNYGSTKPEFILGYLVHHLVPKVWTMSLPVGDQATAKHIETAFAKLKDTFVHFDKLKFRPDSTAQETMAKGLPKSIPVVTNDGLYKASEYTAFNPGRAVGTLRIIPAGKTFADVAFNRDDIVILPEALTDITPVAGIISETFSTPLAHVNLRAIAWNIPNVGLKGAAATYKALAGKKVLLEATHKGHTLREATKDEIRKALVARMTPKVVVIPNADLTVKDLRPLTKISYLDARVFGSKTANLGSVATSKLAGVQVPDGFGIPIAHYAAHLKKAKLDKRIKKLLANKKFRADAAYRKAELEKLRAAIQKAKIDKKLLKDVVAKVEAMAGGKGVFVRSSTNAEDLAGFNGAGLYDTVPNVMGADAMADAIRKVWASVWNLGAFEERELFGVPHDKVYGAILVQTAVDPTSAGVLVTKHPNNPSERYTYTINAKSGLGLRVVGGKKVPETVLYDYKTDGLRVLSRSDETTKLVADPKGGVKSVPIDKPGEPVLSDTLARNLGQAARRVEQLFHGLWRKSLPLDVEWLFEGDTLHIVQVRPYVEPKK